MSNTTYIPRITPEQREFLKTCPPEQKEQRFVLFAYGNLSQQYRSQEHEPTEEDFTRWLVTLPPQIAAYMQAQGLAACKGTPLFMRFVGRRHEEGKEAFIRRNMSPREYEAAQQLLGARR